MFSPLHAKKLNHVSMYYIIIKIMIKYSSNYINHQFLGITL